jgi:Tfp pilus assembly protein PilE
LALFVPYAGRLGAGFGMLIMVYIIGVLAAVAIPAYNDYKVKAVLHTAIADTAGAREALGDYYEKKRKIPLSLEMVGVPVQLPNGNQLKLDSENMVLTVVTSKGELIFSPAIDKQKHIVWNCMNGAGIKPTQLPPTCTSSE